MTKIFLPTPLRAFADGRAEIDLPASDLPGLLSGLTQAYPALTPHLFDGAGNIRRFVTIFVNGEDYRMREEPGLHAGDVVEILPAIAGGSDGAVHFSDLRRDLEHRIEQVEPLDLITPDAGSILLDVRTTEEWREGHLPGAIHIDRGYLEMNIEAQVPDRAGRVVCYCASGGRSLLAAATLEQMGYADVASLRGGIQAWRSAGGQIETPVVLDDAARRRYRRHLAISEVGEAGQCRLLGSRVLVVGAGGLGSPALLYLAAAGVGTITIVDDDVVDESNLQRQVIHSQATIGMAKTKSARDALLALNPTIAIETVEARLDADLANALFPRADVIVDGTDNFTARYLINDLAVVHDRPVVHGSVYRFEGLVSVFRPHVGPCYRCLYPEPPPAELAPSCAEAGVLGVLPGVIGLLQATETLKLLLDCGEPLVGRALRYDALSGKVRELRFRKDPHCAACGGHDAPTSAEQTSVILLAR